MISLNLKLFFIAILSIYFLLILIALRNNKIPMKSSLLWFSFGIILIILIFFPEPLIYLSKFIGIETVSNLLLVSAIIVLFILCFDLYSIFNSTKKKNIILAQELGILKYEISKRKNK